MNADPKSSQETLRVRRGHALRGVCSVPGDKSISHRALLFGALCKGTVEIHGLGLGGDNMHGRLGSDPGLLVGLGADAATALAAARAMARLLSSPSA